ncbi:hypothetical protein [Anaeromyxobacter sp. PSR-1]|uniref:hypothetical protein n=1 Tax=Anaeromyxobacter sp. PSR-1 TaxID=1300915 RepID=UPI00075119B9|nr:hypothetical protein [Anaeromyxobacter sp. PSR-1]
MTGAAIVRRSDGAAEVLTVYGAFDGASAWALRVQMDESAADAFVIDLAHAEEACEFAACVLAGWVREHRREKQVRFRAATREQARLLAAFGLDLDAGEHAAVEPVGDGATGELDGFPLGLRSPEGAGVPA